MAAALSAIHSSFKEVIPAKPALSLPRLAFSITQMSYTMLLTLAKPSDRPSSASFTRLIQTETCFSCIVRKMGRPPPYWIVSFPKAI